MVPTSVAGSPTTVRNTLFGTDCALQNKFLTSMPLLFVTGMLVNEIVGGGSLGVNKVAIQDDEVGAGTGVLVTS